MARSGLNSGGEYIQHVGAVRLRVDGSGSLNMTLYGINSVDSFPMLPLAMLDPDSMEPTMLTNFRSQRFMFEFGVTEINEYFEISRIVFFIKTSALNYPGIR